MREHLDLPPGDDGRSRPFLKLTMVSAELLRVRPSELCGRCASAQRMARALALDPEIVFLDRANPGLNPIGASKLDHLIHDDGGLQLTVYMVTHKYLIQSSPCETGWRCLQTRRIVPDWLADGVATPAQSPFDRGVVLGERARAASPGERPKDADFSA